MRKKISSILTVALIAMILLVTLVSCNQSSTVDFFDYSEKNMNFVGQLVLLMHKWIGNYGWTVVVFTVFLKLIMLPLDFWQRYSARKSSLKMQRIQPLLEGIDKRYGANTQRANEEKQKLYKKQGYSMLSTCLPMIISMVIFFVMFAGLRDYSKYSMIETFGDLSAGYYQSLENDYRSKVGDATFDEYLTQYGNECDSQTDDKVKNLSGYENLKKLYAQTHAISRINETLPATYRDAAYANAKDAVQKQYLEEKESWLWIKNVWQPDTWANVWPTYDGNSDQNAFTKFVNMNNFPEGRELYNTIREAIVEIDGYGQNGAWNGLMILPFLSVGLSFLSMWISQHMEKKKRKGEEPTEKTAQSMQQQATNRMMMIIMPLMMAVFGFMYTGAFAIYMVCNYLISIISTIALRWPVEKLVEKNLAKTEQKEKSGKASYMR